MARRPTTRAPRRTIRVTYIPPRAARRTVQVVPLPRAGRGSRGGRGATGGREH